MLYSTNPSHLQYSDGIWLFRLLAGIKVKNIQARSFQACMKEILKKYIKMDL